MLIAYQSISRCFKFSVNAEILSRLGYLNLQIECEGFNETFTKLG